MLLLGLGVAAAFAALAGYCFVLIARTCRITGARNYMCVPLAAPRRPDARSY